MNFLFNALFIWVFMYRVILIIIIIVYWITRNPKSVVLDERYIPNVKTNIYNDDDHQQYMIIICGVKKKLLQHYCLLNNCLLIYIIYMLWSMEQINEYAANATVEAGDKC